MRFTQIRFGASWISRGFRRIINKVHDEITAWITDLIFADIHNSPSTIHQPRKCISEKARSPPLFPFIGKGARGRGGAGEHYGNHQSGNYRH